MLDIPQALVVKISYHDIEVMMDIVNKFVGITANAISPATANAPKNLPAPASSPNLIPQVDQVKKGVLEKCSVAFRGMRLILIDDLNNLHLPIFDGLVDPFQVTVVDWSSALNVMAEIPLQLSFYNIKNSHWEPIIEKLSFNVEMTNKNGVMDALVDAKRRIEVNLSQDCLETVMFIQNMWNQKLPVRE